METTTYTWRKCVKECVPVKANIAAKKSRRARPWLYTNQHLLGITVYGGIILLGMGITQQLNMACILEDMFISWMSLLYTKFEQYVTRILLWRNRTPHQMDVSQCFFWSWKCPKQFKCQKKNLSVACEEAVLNHHEMRWEQALSSMKMNWGPIAPVYRLT